jgi:hypothetical protein
VAGPVLLITLSPLCANIGVAFVKLFQIIEILSKLIYLPVTFSGTLRDILHTIAKLGDPIYISPNLIMKGSLAESHSNYKGKIFEFEEYGNILQSQPITTPVFIFLEILLQLLALIKAKKKYRDYVKNMQVLMIELSITDMSFYAMLNLSTFTGFSEITLPKLVSYAMAICILSRIVWVYFGVFSNLKLACYCDNVNPKKPNHPNYYLRSKISAAELEVIFEGINQDIPPWKRHKAAVINYVFKL